MAVFDPKYSTDSMQGEKNPQCCDMSIAGLINIGNYKELHWDGYNHLHIQFNLGV